MQKLLVVSSYPEKGSTHSKRTVGVASYTKILLEGLVKNTNWKVKVFAEKIGRTSHYKEKGVEIERVWERGNLASIFELFTKIIKSDSKKVLLSFEIYLFGGLIHSLAGILGLLAARISGKKTFVLLHQVAVDFQNLEANKFKASLLNILSNAFYFLVKNASSEIYVFEKALKDKLGGENKIKVLPHLVPDTKKINKETARKKLGLATNKLAALYFGYIAPYKGVDWLVKNWPEGNMDLIIAGGINPNHKNDPKISQFVKSVGKKAKEKGIRVSGFVNERDIKYYFSACDLIILPYKMFFSSSGPLALAFSYGKPVLISSVLGDYAKTIDFKKALKSSGLKEKDIVFEFKEESLKKSLGYVSKNKSKFQKLALGIKNSRSLANISKSLKDFLVNV